MKFYMKLKFAMLVLLGLKLVLEWGEREHEDMDQEALQDAPTMNVLCSSGLLKFFYTSPMQPMPTS